MHGTVLDALGAPVVGARIVSEVFLGSCATGQRIGSGSPTVELTAGNGTYVQRVVSGSSVTGQCVQVKVTRPNAAVVAVTKIAGPVQFKLTSDASLPYNSVIVDVQLP